MSPFPLSLPPLCSSASLWGRRAWGSAHPKDQQVSALAWSSASTDPASRRDSGGAGLRSGEGSGCTAATRPYCFGRASEVTA